MTIQSLYNTFNRYRTLRTDIISSLPIAILMPHSACNCRCVMCDIWKGNKNLKQLTEEDITGLLSTLKKFGTQQVLMSGGEALLNPNFFRFCEILKQQQIRISLLSTGLTLKKNAPKMIKWVDDLIISIDGDEQLHDVIRDIPGAFNKLREGIEEIRSIAPYYPISGRTVIHRLNFRHWPNIIESAKDIGLDRISFLPADVTSNAFNREQRWNTRRQNEVLPAANELQELKTVLQFITSNYAGDFRSRFIAESPAKLQMIYQYYAAFYGLNGFPYKKCNAPWVSTVIEADGTVRPCFFHQSLGNIHTTPLEQIINSESAVAFRKNLDMDNNDTCIKCVCYLNLAPNKSLS